MFMVQLARTAISSGARSRWQTPCLTCGRPRLTTSDLLIICYLILLLYVFLV
jgi:hypothetical protein